MTFNEDNDILMCCETHLTRRFQLEGFKSIQTRLDRKGGCWIGSRLKKTKPIKALGTDLCWLSTAIDNVPIYLLCCYMEPQARQKTNFSIQKLVNIIDSILQRLPSSRIIVAGDLNDRFGEVNDLMIKRNLKPIIPAGIATHNLGGQLD